MDGKLLLFVLVFLTGGAWTQRDTRGSNAGNDNIQIQRNSLFACPRQYIDALARCLQRLSCADDNDCSSQRVCCSNACGSKTCVDPWYPKNDDEDDSVCSNVSCTRQGTTCKVVGGKPECLCVDSCGPPVSNNDFVCADDGMMYFTSCFMDMEACQSQKTITQTICNSLPTPNTNVLTPGDADSLSDIPDSELRPPTVISVQGIVVAEERSSVSLRCDVTGYPKPKIFWQTMEEGELLGPNAVSGRISVSAQTRELVIDNVHVSDTGRYSCYAANKGGVASIKFRIKVTAIQESIRRGGRSSKVECGTFPTEQARRCGPEETQRRIKKLWIYNRNKKNCVKSYFRDCRAITNKFPTWSECANACMDICKLPPKKGNCRQFTQRIFYDHRTGNCLPFAFSGCQGNQNNFPDVFACRARCPSITPNNRSVAIPSTPQTPSCPPCYMQEAQSVCRSEFVVIGILKHFRLRPATLRSAGQTHQSLHIQLTKVIQDKSTNLNLGNLNLENHDAARLEISLELDDDCPCPDLRDFVSSTEANLSAVNTRRLPAFGRSNEVEVIIAGKTVSGVPTLDSSGFASKYNEKSFRRIANVLKLPHFCKMLNIK
uniref:WAP, Kazal, immunoglobulin, Kunitz and NTR domain-containing protein 2-like n=1 Tax=Styela clava TaxID=7725 RepID=UPI00193AB22F|nr:WAP, Kazal, immunoglobulin, Kunitz and NTR domain-containing protein 2-like [Styela clava]